MIVSEPAARQRGAFLVAVIALAGACSSVRLSSEVPRVSIDLQPVRQAVAVVDVDGSAARPSDGYLSSSEIKEAVYRLDFAIAMGNGADQTVPQQQRAALLSFLTIVLAAEARGDSRGAPYMKGDFYEIRLDPATLRAAVFVDAVYGDNDGRISPDESKKIAAAKNQLLQEDTRIHCAPAPPEPKI